MIADGKTVSLKFATPGQSVRARLISARGMSLVEVLIALVLLVVGLGGVLQFYERQVQQAARLERRAQAVRRAENRLALFQSLGYAEIKSRYLPGGGEATEQGTESAGERKALWRWSAHFSEASIAGLPPAICIAVESEWVARRSAEAEASGAVSAGSPALQKAVGYVVAR